MSLSDVKITFDPAAIPGEFDYVERIRFWESARPSLAQVGYTLYKLSALSEDNYFMQSTLPNYSEYGGDYPYAFHDSLEEPSSNGKKWMYYCFTTGVVVFAQDRVGRHVALKILKADSDHYRIFRMLLEEQSKYTSGRIPGILPTLDLLPFGGHWLVVMPRWATSHYTPWFPIYSNIMRYIHHLLQGLEFLHRHRILHRDIASQNILVNHICDFTPTIYTSAVNRMELYSRGIFEYALYDFGYSLLLPQSTDIRKCRRPEEEIWHATSNRLNDVMQGEYDYDPFAFDVGCLGHLLCKYFQHLCIDLPMLAPLLDKMVDSDPSKRFTAEEALRFFEEQFAMLGEKQLQVHAEEIPDGEQPHPESFDRWVGLPLDFVKAYGHLRMSKVGLMTKLLRFLCRNQWIRYFIQKLRRLL